jgi:hypothetical protein
MSSNYPFDSGPIAPERNPPINPQYYSPARAQIASITSISQTYTQVVTTEENQFVVGQVVRFNIPFGDGMDGLDGTQSYVVSIINGTTFLAGVNTANFNAFNAGGNPQQYPYVVPIGDVNSGAINSSGAINNTIYIEGSFINISPE